MGGAFTEIKQRSFILKNVQINWFTVLNETLDECFFSFLFLSNHKKYELYFSILIGFSMVSGVIFQWKYTLGV